MPEVEINYWAVLVAAVLGMGVGALWYSPLMFSKQWLKAIGKKAEDLDGPGTIYVIAFIALLVTAYVLAYIIGLVDAVTVGQGMQAGFIAWLGFVAPILATNYLFEGRPRRLYWITAGHHLVVLLVMGGLIGVWI